MAEERDETERSEEPTQKRLNDAIERGDVVKSQEVNTWFIIGAATLSLLIFSGTVGGGLQTTLRGLIAHAHDVRVDGGGVFQLLRTLETDVLAAVALPFLLLM